ncbi:hypothetical protein D3C86_1176470 [compost metagenome]
MGQVQAGTEAVILAKALTDVQVFADAPVVADVRGEPSQWHVTGALGLQVDAATDAGTGRGDTVDEGVRPLEHFHALQGIGGNDLPRQDAVQAVKGNIIAVQRQAANHEGLGLVGKAGSLTHRGIVEQHVADGFGLLVADQLFGVGRHGERNVHDVLVAQDTQLTAACDLTSGVDRGQVGRCRSLGVDIDVAQHQRFSLGLGCFGRCGMGRQGQGAKQGQ